MTSAPGMNVDAPPFQNLVRDVFKNAPPFSTDLNLCPEVGAIGTNAYLITAVTQNVL
jgi:hypothetical protein